MLYSSLNESLARALSIATIASHPRLLLLSVKLLLSRKLFLSKEEILCVHGVRLNVISLALQGVVPTILSDSNLWLQS